MDNGAVLQEGRSVSFMKVVWKWYVVKLGGSKMKASVL